jgi:hypothetical protein
MSQDYIKEIYKCFENTRSALKQKFGNKMTFYRVDINLDHPDNEKYKKIEKNIKIKLVSDKQYDLKVWKKFYKYDIEEGLRHVVSITVPTDDVLAIYREKRSNYREVLILTKRAKYTVIE